MAPRHPRPPAPRTALILPLLDPLHELAAAAPATQRRAIEPCARHSSAALPGLPPAWEPAARLLVTTGGRALRASSAAENGHRMLRPHLAAHRTLAPDLLAVRHNHRVFACGLEPWVGCS